MPVTTKRAAIQKMQTKVKLPSRKRGGDVAAVNGKLGASTKTRSRVERSAAAGASARPKQRRAITDSTSKALVPGDSASEGPGANGNSIAGGQNNGRSKIGLSAGSIMNGHAGGDRGHDAEGSGAASTNKRHSGNAPTPRKNTNGSGNGEGTSDTEHPHTAPDNKRHAGNSGTSEVVMRGSGNGDHGFEAAGRRAVSLKHKATNGDSISVADGTIAVRRTKQAAGDHTRVTDTRLACRSIQELQRHRCAAIKMQVAGENRIVAHVAMLLGYRAGLDEKDRKKRFTESRALIKQIVADATLPSDQEAIAARVRPLVLAANSANALIVATREAYEKEMKSLAKSLPVYGWVHSIRGFGDLNLAIVVGEAGDLSNYSKPAKLWKRLGLAPFKGGMGSTHRRQGGLSKDEWSAFGYSPRRRSQLHLLSCNMVMNNDGEYRKRYEEARAAAKVNHPDWTDGHLHAHGMLLALKRVIRDLWRQWKPDRLIVKEAS